MTDKVMRMAIECQLINTSNRTGIYADALQKFANLIRADEREALCKAMEDQNTWNWDDPADTAIQVIRARGNT
jgi:hypothetical protein